MSTLFLCRKKESSILSGYMLEPLEATPQNVQFFQAIDCWGWGVNDSWLMLDYLNGQLLDDLIAESIEDEDSRERFCAMLFHVASQCSSAAIWYAGFHDKIQAVETPMEFVECIRAALVQRNFEPSVRMVIPM